jgi:hypothetical protein
MRIGTCHGQLSTTASVLCDTGIVVALVFRENACPAIRGTCLWHVMASHH